MRLETGHQLYEGFEQVLETTQECPVDTEYNLPDYCADIQKILKCIVTPEITSAVVMGDSVSVEGSAEIRVLYLDAKGDCVRGFDTKKEFQFMVRLNDSPENAAVQVRPWVQHLTCRAMNARRVDMHITLGFAVSVFGVRRTEMIGSVTGAPVETKCVQYPVSKAVGCCSHAFILEENLPLQNGKPTIETILRRSVQYRVDHVQASGDEIRFSGRACVEILYRSFADSSLPEHMLFEIPFEETVSCTDADELCTVSAVFTGGECSIQPREDSVGEYTIFNIYLKPSFVLKVFKPDTVTLVNDAFATKGLLAAKYGNAVLEHLEPVQMRQIRVREVLRIPEGELERVLDLWCEGLTVSDFTERDVHMLRGKFMLCLLYRSKEKRIVYTERMLDFTETGAETEGGKSITAGEITAARFVITDPTALECTVELQLQEQVRILHSVRALESVQLDDDAQEETCCAAVYYADAGEQLWDIAKRYRAPVASIRNHNHGISDTIEAARPLIICR
ncbi:MAG: DUF3794 domain-containing protein [Clostridia bacterium]|nr:DUF3794 domain-containing protein [Clostridia bacterium]